MIVQRDRAALVVVDMENDFVHGPMAVSGADALVARLAPLLEAARSARVPVIFVTQALRAGGEDVGGLERFDEVRNGSALREGTTGVDVVSELGARADDLYVVKRRFGAFFGTDLDLLLRSRGVQQVIVCGISAHVCCDTTVREAFQLGYDPLYVVDGVAMGDLPDAGWGAIPAEEAHRVVATVLAHRFARPCFVADLLADLRV